LFNLHAKDTALFLATGLQSYTFDVSDVAGIDRKE